MITDESRKTLSEAAFAQIYEGEDIAVFERVSLPVLYRNGDAAFGPHLHSVTCHVLSAS